VSGGGGRSGELVSLEKGELLGSCGGGGSEGLCGVLRSARMSVPAEVRGGRGRETGSLACREGSRSSNQR
jgi:hypothetical protein